MVEAEQAAEHMEQVVVADTDEVEQVVEQVVTIRTMVAVTTEDLQPVADPLRPAAA